MPRFYYFNVNDVKMLDLMSMTLYTVFNVNDVKTFRGVKYGSSRKRVVNGEVLVKWR